MRSVLESTVTICSKKFQLKARISFTYISFLVFHCSVFIVQEGIVRLLNIFIMEKGGSGKNGALTKASDVGERKPLLKKRKVTIIASPLKGEDDPNATSWISIYMASALSFVGAAQYTLYFTSLWPYIRKVPNNSFNF